MFFTQRPTNDKNRPRVASRLHRMIGSAASRKGGVAAREWSGGTLVACRSCGRCERLAIAGEETQAEVLLRLREPASIEIDRVEQSCIEPLRSYQPDDATNNTIPHSGARLAPVGTKGPPTPSDYSHISLHNYSNDSIPGRNLRWWWW